MAAHYQAQQAGQNPPAIEVFDSSRVTSMDAFYAQAKAAGVQLVVGPLEKPLVKQLSTHQQLPITTLALNYSDSTVQGPAELFQFGLAAEDEAREVARRAWADGKRSAVAMVPKGEWGDRVLEAFRQSWQAKGGTFLGVERIDQPVALAQQVADLFQLRNSEGRAQPAKHHRRANGRAAEPSPGRRLHVPGRNPSASSTDQADHGFPVRR